MGKPNCNGKKELKKGPWTREEDQKLLAYIDEHGHGSWRSLPAKAGLERCGKSCRLRWTNYLRPDIKRGKFSTHEEKTIIRLHALLGNRWSAIAAHLPKRTDNEIKNYWNTRLKKRLTRMGIDPTTHKPKNATPVGSAQSKHAANLSHMAQWETARLEAEARLARASKLHLLRRFTAPRPPPPPQRAAALPCLDVLRVWQANGGSLDSPTSTLNFSCNSVTIPPAAGPVMIGNDVVSVNGCYGACGVGKPLAGGAKGKGKIGISSQQIHNDDVADYVYDGYDLTGAVNLVAVDHNHEGYDNNNSNNNNNVGDDVVGEFEDIKNYWNDILNLVSSPMELPGL